jgi:hypothetical protein
LFWRLDLWNWPWVKGAFEKKELKMSKKRGLKKENLNLKAILNNTNEAVERNVKFEKKQQKSKKKTKRTNLIF